MFHGTFYVTGKWYTDSSPSILKELHRLPVDARIKFKIATLTLKALNTGNPPYLASLLVRHTPCSTLRVVSGSSTLQCVWCRTLASMTEVWRTFGVTFCTGWMSLIASVSEFASRCSSVSMGWHHGTGLLVYYVPQSTIYYTVYYVCVVHWSSATLPGHQSCRLSTYVQ